MVELNFFCEQSGFMLMRPRLCFACSSYVVRVQRVTTSRVAKRDAFVPRRHADSPGDYIAAEWAGRSVPETFLVGDNKRYGGYLNAPLVAGTQTDISVGSVSRGNETVSASTTAAFLATT